MIVVFKDLGKRFTETSDNLFAQDTKVIMSENDIDNNYKSRGNGKGTV